MFEKKFIVFTVLITVLVLGVGIFLVSKDNAGQVASDSTMSENARLVVEESSYDWGEIGIDDGNVEKTFNIKNEGSENLSLSDVVTSCMCTTAQLILGGETSPEFGMHSKSRYVMDVPPGETAQLKVVFDPAFHGPSGVGPITRQVEVKTNDQDNPEIMFILKALVSR
jgi:hypothetical protein